MTTETDNLREHMVARARHPKKLVTMADAKRAWEKYRSYKEKAWDAYTDFKRNSSDRHYARYEAHAIVADEWESALSEWFDRHA